MSGDAAPTWLGGDRQPTVPEFLAWLDTLPSTRRLTVAARARRDASELRACPRCGPRIPHRPAGEPSEDHAPDEWLAWFDRLPGGDRLAVAQRVLADNLAATDCFIRNHPRPPEGGPE